MFRPASRAVLRAAAQSSLAPARTIIPRRFASTSPVNSRRSWKSGALRWGIAIAGVYYYNTSPVFAEQPSNNLLNPNLEAIDETYETSPLDELTSRRKNKSQNAAAIHSAADAISSENASTTVVGDLDQPLDSDTTGGAAGLEDEAASQGAFNPETGEINWDCPCLGGMAHGPCGPEFKEAFSCFVFSTEEPKGMDCIDKFQNMQQCFQQHPEVYKGELEDNEELDAELEGEKQKLVDEIAERKAQQKDAVPQRRLLEEPASEPRPAKDRSKKAAKPGKPASVPGQETPSDATISTGDEKLPSSTTSDGAHEEGTKSSTVRDPRSSSAETSTPLNEDVIPKAAHDARGQDEQQTRGTEN